MTVTEPGQEPAHLRTDFAGNCSYTLRQQSPYQLHVEKPGFYATDASGIEAGQTSVKVVLAHEQIVREQVNVTASPPGIDTQEIPDQTTMNTPEIVNIPYQTSRDIRYLLPFFPGVVQDATEQVHVAGSETWETLDTIDGFDVRSPAEGTLDMRVSTDAVRSIDSETTRYPVEYGRATGGVLAFSTGMGDNKFRFNATNFIPVLPRPERNPLRQIRAAVYVLRAAQARPRVVVRRRGDGVRQHLHLRAAGQRRYRPADARQQSGEGADQSCRGTTFLPRGCSSTITTRRMTASRRSLRSRARPNATSSPGCPTCATNGVLRAAGSWIWASGT